jgi:hypothetical protein
MDKKYYIEIYDGDKKVGFLEKSSVYYNKLVVTDKIENARSFDSESRAKSTVNLIKMLSGETYKGRLVMH